MIRRPPRSTPFPSPPLFRPRAQQNSRLRAAQQLVAGEDDGVHAAREGLGHCGLAREAPGREVQQERSEEHTSELQSQSNLVCRLLLEKKKKNRLRVMHPTWS